MDPAAIADFVRTAGTRMGHPALSEAKMLVLTEPDRVVVIAEDDRIMAVGVVADHRQADGIVHQAVETVVDTGMQFPEFERACLSATLELTSSRGVSVWSRRPSLDAALRDLGFVPVRTLRFMVTELPLGPAGIDVRPIEAFELDDLIALNNEAFSGHREAGGMTRAEFDRIAGEAWFDLEGIVVHEDSAGLAAFCWTKVHPDGAGEIYRIGVRTDARGSGLGRAMTLAGFEDLSQRHGCRRGTLWVDERNAAAVRLYESMGLDTKSVNREFERP
jgi:mycothiol synthase